LRDRDLQSTLHASHGGGGDTHHRETTEHKRSPGESEE